MPPREADRDRRLTPVHWRPVSTRIDPPKRTRPVRRRAMATPPSAGHRRLGRPADLQRAREPGRRSPPPSSRRSPARRCSSSTTPRRTGRASSPTRSPPPTRASASGTARRKQGLGRAYLDGFGVALARRRGGRGPDGRRLVARPGRAARAASRPSSTGRADLVIGSRYTTGGGVEDWGLVRRIISRGGSIFARIVLGLGPHDLTGGFKAWRATTLAAVPFDGVRAGGYVFQIEMTYRASRLGARIVEVPIIFRDRRVGQSKMSRRIIVEALFVVIGLRWDELRGRGPVRAGPMTAGWRPGETGPSALRRPSPRACASSSTCARSRTRSARPLTALYLEALLDGPRRGPRPRASRTRSCSRSTATIPTDRWTNLEVIGRRLLPPTRLPALRGAHRGPAAAPRRVRRRRLAGRAGRRRGDRLPRGGAARCRSGPGSRSWPRSSTWPRGRCRTTTSAGPPPGSGSGSGRASSGTRPRCSSPGGPSRPRPAGCST